MFKKIGNAAKNAKVKVENWVEDNPFTAGMILGIGYTLMLEMLDISSQKIGYQRAMSDMEKINAAYDAGRASTSKAEQE